MKTIISILIGLTGLSSQAFEGLKDIRQILNTREAVHAGTGCSSDRQLRLQMSADGTLVITPNMKALSRKGGTAIDRESCMVRIQYALPRGYALATDLVAARGVARIGSGSGQVFTVVSAVNGGQSELNRGFESGSKNYSVGNRNATVLVGCDDQLQTGILAINSAIVAKGNASMTLQSVKTQLKLVRCLR
jgi:hypothetical protein